jgi:hypothetical protein
MPYICVLRKKSECVLIVCEYACVCVCLFVRACVHMCVCTFVFHCVHACMRATCACVCFVSHVYLGDIEPEGVVSVEARGDL